MKIEESGRKPLTAGFLLDFSFSIKQILNGKGCFIKLIYDILESLINNIESSCKVKSIVFFVI